MTAHPSPTGRLLGALATLLLVGGTTLVPGLVAQDAPRDPPTATEGVDYRVYDRSGARTSLRAIVEAARSHEVVLVGEEHDDMPGHAFEALLLEEALRTLARPEPGAGRPVVLSLEMFERDVQYVVDEYLADLISEAHFLRSSRPWDDYDVRYRPMVEAAKRHGAPVVAANAPRRYVNRVTSHGPGSLDALSDLAKSYLPPLPYPGPSAIYRAQWDALMAEAMAQMGPAAPPEAQASPDTAAATAEDEEEGPDHSGPANAIYAQALWDAAMGHAITTALVDHLGALVVHFAGSFHVERGTGIPERIDDYRPGTRVLSVVMTKVDDIDAWSSEQHGELGDYVVLTRNPADTAAAGR